MAWLWRQKDLQPEDLKQEEVQQFIRKHADVLDHAVDVSLREVPLDEVSVRRLKDSNYVFSGIKTFHELNEALPSLVGDDGRIKPFNRFLNEVQRIHQSYNVNYLRTEYNLAQASSLMAARWKQFEQDGDRYLLQYRTVGDKRVRRSHRMLHNITLPITSKFWDEYFPPNNFGCRCSAVQVRKGKYPVSDEQEAMKLGMEATAGKYREMFLFNPGKTMTCFPAYNAYTRKACATCRQRPGNMELAANIPDNELCQACRVVQEIVKEKQRIRERRKEIQHEASSLKDEVFHHPDFKYDIRITGRAIKEWLNQPHKYYAEKNEKLLSLSNLLENAKYLGYGPDKHDALIKAHLFETKIHGSKSWIIVREFSPDRVEIHSISDSERIKEIIKKKSDSQ